MFRGEIMDDGDWQGVIAADVLEVRLAVHTARLSNIAQNSEDVNDHLAKAELLIDQLLMDLEEDLCR
jgi:hypothetical protein